MGQTIDYDVAVVGAGIAGCAAATFLGREGLCVALIERHASPGAYKALCTHYIQASATPTIQRLGLARALEDAGAVRNASDMWTRFGWSRPAAARPAGAEPHGYNLRREKLDPLLRTLAAETPGVELLAGHSADGLIERDGAVAGVRLVDRAGTTRELRARLVVGADGNHSRVAELAGVAAKERPNSRFGHFAYFRDLPLASGTRSLMWLHGLDVAYVFPNDDGLTVLACMLPKARLAEFQSDVERSFAAFFASLPDAPVLDRTQRVSKFFGMLDYPLLERPPVPRAGLALIGDAALTSDPLWGVGCGWAFQSAEWLAECATPALTNGGRRDLAGALRSYARRHRKAFAGHESLIADYARVRDFNALERLMFSAAARDPKTAEHVERFGTRSIAVRRFLSPPAVARAAFVNLRWRLRPPPRPAERPAAEPGTGGS